MRKDGQPLSFVLSYNVENATRRNVVVQLQAMLRNVGIDTQIKTHAFNVLWGTYAQGGILATGKYDLNVTGFLSGVDPDDHSSFACEQIPRPSRPQGYNFSRYCTKAMDAAQAEALKSYDEAARKRAYVKIQQLLARDLPMIYLWHARQLQPIDPGFRGFAPNPVNESWNAHQWEISTNISGSRGARNSATRS